jgi:hypothetical protein
MAGTVWGVAVVALSLVCWGGQCVAWLAPSTAVRLGLMESEEAVEPTYWADIRGEAVWDAATLWVLVVAGALLAVDHSAWPYFGLAGGGMYVYFSGRGILTRIAMRRRGFRIGDPASRRLGYTFLSIWGVMGGISLIAATVSLASR